MKAVRGSRGPQGLALPGTTLSKGPRAGWPWGLGVLLMTLRQAPRQPTRTQLHASSGVRYRSRRGGPALMGPRPGKPCRGGPGQPCAHPYQGRAAVRGSRHSPGRLRKGRGTPLLQGPRARAGHRGLAQPCWRLAGRPQARPPQPIRNKAGDSTGSAATHDQIEQTLARRIGELDPAARRLRAALLRGETPQSLGLIEDGLATVLNQRGISPTPPTPPTATNPPTVAASSTNESAASTDTPRRHRTFALDPALSTHPADRIMSWGADSIDPGGETPIGRKVASD